MTGEEKPRRVGGEPGFTWFSVMDHLIQIGNVGARYLHGAAGRSCPASPRDDQLRLATLVSSVHYRNPAHLAKIPASTRSAAADLRHRRRRFETEYRQYGWESSAAARVRIRQMEEAVRLILVIRGRPPSRAIFQPQGAILEPDRRSRSLR